MLTRDCKQPSPYAEDQSLYHAGEASYRLCISHDPCMSTFCTNNHMTSLQQSIRIITPSWHHSIITPFHSPLPICCIIAASQLLHHHCTASQPCFIIAFSFSDSFFVLMTHSPFYDSFCIGCVLFFEIAQSLPLKRSTFIPFPLFIALFIALLIAWSVALHTQMYAGTILYINPCTLATEQSTSPVHHSMSILL